MAMPNGMTTLINFISIFFIFQSFAFAQVNLECRESYSRLFNKNEIKISIYVGYNEGYNSSYKQYVSIDVSQKKFLIEELTKKCLATGLACGFSKENSVGDILSKTIIGPDLQVTKIIVKIKNASLTESDALNRAAKNKELQRTKSKQIEDDFLNALSQDDIVFFLGHSRMGTGPGFSPTEKEDWLTLTKTKPGLNRLIEALKNARRKPKIIGMISCNSENNYGKVLAELAPESALVLTKQLTTFEDGERIVLSNIDALLGFRCKEEYRKRMSLATYYFYKSPGMENKTFADLIPDIFGFFETNTHQFIEAVSPDVQYELNLKMVQIVFPPAKRNDSDNIHFQNKK